MTPIDFELEQYRALREEVLRSMEDGNHVMSFGLAAIALLLGAALEVRESLAGYLVVALGVPALSGLVLSMWFAAQERVARASHFLTGVEARIFETLKSANSGWENWLRTPDPKGHPSRHFWNTEYSGVAIFVFFMVGPLLLAATAVGGTGIPTRVRVFVTLAGSVSLLIYALWLLPRFGRWRGWLSETFSP